MLLEYRQILFPKCILNLWNVLPKFYHKNTKTDSFSLLKPFKKLHRLVINPKGTGQGEGDREDHGLGEEEGEHRGDEGGPGGVVVGDVQLAEILQPLGVGPRPVEVSDGLSHLHSTLVSSHFKYLMTS